MTALYYLVMSGCRKVPYEWLRRSFAAVAMSCRAAGKQRRRILQRWQAER